MSAGVQHHYPAALLGQFGVMRGPNKRSRRRIVAVAERGKEEIAQRRAERLGYSGGALRLYELTTIDCVGVTIDEQWAHVEQRIPKLVRALMGVDHGAMSPTLFVRTLVPLVAQLLVRHPDFEDRYRLRLQSYSNRGGPVLCTPDEVNRARAIDYLFLCGRLIHCEWRVLKSPTPLVSSDLGFAGAVYRTIEGATFPPEAPDESMGGYVVPLASNLAVFVHEGKSSYQLERAQVALTVSPLTPDKAEETNMTIAAWAPRQVFGKSQAVVRRATQIWRDRPEQSIYTRTVPSMLFSKGAGFSIEDTKNYFRALHHVQWLREPHRRLALQDFESCPLCRERMRRLAAVWPPAIAS